MKTVNEEPIEEEHDHDDEPSPSAGFNYKDWLTWSEVEVGVLRINRGITEVFSEILLRQISYIERKQLPKLTIFINCGGGGAYPSFALYDALMALRKKGVCVDAVVEGWAASAAAMIILQAAETRRARANARFLMHEARRWVFWSVERTSDLEDEVAEMRALDERIMQILSRRCGKTVDEIRSVVKRKEVWLSATEALEFGLIDEVL